MSLYEQDFLKNNFVQRNLQKHTHTHGGVNIVFVSPFVTAWQQLMVSTSRYIYIIVEREREVCVLLYVYELFQAWRVVC